MTDAPVTSTSLGERAMNQTLHVRCNHRLLRTRDSRSCPLGLCIRLLAVDQNGRAQGS